MNLPFSLRSAQGELSPHSIEHNEAHIGNVVSTQRKLCW
jgi:hypothetical protein